MASSGSYARRIALAPLLAALSSCADDTSLAARSDGGPLDAAVERLSFDAAREALVPPPFHPDVVPPATSCNGSPVLCDRAYDSVAFLVTHNATAAGTQWSTPTQGRSLEEQFSIGGVRAFEFELHSNGGVLSICMGSCADGNESLSNVLDTVRTFLDRNPNDVLTLLVRNEASDEALQPAFDSARLTEVVHTQALGATWPTLAEMIAAGHRLVVFVDSRARRVDAGKPVDAGSEAGAPTEAGPDGSVDSSDGSPSPAWVHRADEWLWETAPSVGQDCVPAIGDERRPLIVLNHYEATNDRTDAGLLAAHDADRVAARLRRCREDRGHRPTLVVVDFAEVGDPNGGVQIENGVR